MDHPSMAAAIARIRSAGEKVGKTMWRIGDGKTLVEEGFHFLCIAEPIAVLQGALSRLNDEAKEGG